MQRAIDESPHVGAELGTPVLRTRVVTENDSRERLAQYGVQRWNAKLDDFSRFVTGRLPKITSKEVETYVEETSKDVEKTLQTSYDKFVGK